MNWKSLSLISAWSIILFGGSINYRKQDDGHLVIRGTVIAYLPQRQSIVIDGARGQSVVIRIDRVTKGKESSAYVLGVYQYHDGQASLQKDFLEGRSQGRFVLTRQNSCDKSLLELEPPLGSKTEEAPAGMALLSTPSLVWSSEVRKIPPKLQLPCYVFGPSDLKVIKR
jgi:hypothetical protein